MTPKVFLFTGMLITVFGNALADVKEVVAYRQGVMKANAGHMAALKATLIGGQKQFLSQAVIHGEAIQKLAGSIPDMFPPGSTHRKSKATEAIWRNFEDFSAKAKNLERLAGEFVQAAKSGDEAAMTAAFKKLGKEGCSACHEAYRKD